MKHKNSKPYESFGFHTNVLRNRKEQQNETERAVPEQTTVQHKESEPHKKTVLVEEV